MIEELLEKKQARGHLESKPRSETGAVITYRVPKEAALVDTSVFGGVFAESEILIDTSKAKIQDIDIRYWDVEEEESHRGGRNDQACSRTVKSKTLRACKEC